MLEEQTAASPHVPTDRMPRIALGRKVLDLIEDRVSKKGKAKAQWLDGSGFREVTPVTRARFREEAIRQFADQEGLTETDVKVGTQLAELVHRICPDPRYSNTSQQTMIDAVLSGRLPITPASLTALEAVPNTEQLDALRRELEVQI